MARSHSADWPLPQVRPDAACAETDATLCQGLGARSVREKQAAFNVVMSLNYKIEVIVSGHNNLT